MLKTKVILTAIVICIGGVLTILMNGVGSNATQYQSEGVVIDFGSYETVWTDVSFNETSDPVELLNIACESNFKTAPVFTDGVLTSITTKEKTVANDATHTWGLWYVEKGKTDFAKSDNYTIKASDYTVISWAYTETNAKPAIAVDATATSIYGYAQPNAMVTLSPVCTEIVGAMQAATMIVGTDESSDYPTLVAEQKGKTIKVVGTYMAPSYEAIMSVAPDMVVCDASSINHITMAGTLRSSNINSVVVYDGTDLETVINNIFIVGVAMHYELRAQYVLSEIKTALDNIEAKTASVTGHKTLVTLSAMASPFVAGTDTYMNDIIYTVNSTNAINDPAWPGSTPKNGWPNITASMIKDLNPSYIVVLDFGTYTVDQYDEMLASLSYEWKSTDAYKNGNIYLFTEKLGEMAQRSGPRIAQLTELIARATNADAFDDGITLPKAIGNDYQDYLTYTKDLGFDG